MVRAFFKASPVGGRALPWGRWLAVTSSLAGLLWGVGAVVLFPEGAVTHQAILLIVLAGTCSGTVVAYSPLRALFVPFALLTGLPTATMFFLYGGALGPMLGVIVVMYVGIMILTGERMHSATQEALQLRFENQDLVDSLVAEKRETESLNTSLLTEIAERRKIEQALRESEELYRELVELSPIAIAIHCDGIVRFANRAAAVVAGAASVDQLLGTPVLSLLMPESRDGSLQRVRDMLTDWKPAPVTELKWVRLDGTIHHAEVHSTPIMYESKPAVLMVAIDTTDRRQAEQGLRESEQRFRELAELMPQFVLELDSEGRFTFLNRFGLQGLGYATEDLTEGLKFEDIIVSEERDRAVTTVSEIVAGAVAAGSEFTALAKDGTMFPVLMYSSPITRSGTPVGMRAVALDITDLKSAQARLKASVQEKEVLLREIHHRVKNNLAVVDGLLALQSDFSPDEAHYGIFENVRGRIRSMALVHELLYRADNLAEIDARQYITRLVDHLVDSAGSASMTIEVKKLIEPVFLGIETAMSVGFIVNELVSNCLKHAFPNGGIGEIAVCLRSLTEDTLELSISDTGGGMPRGMAFSKRGTLGLELVESFVKKLHGEMETRTELGLRVRITFKKSKHPTSG